MKCLILLLISLISTTYAEEYRHNEGLYADIAPKTLKEKKSIEFLYGFYTYHLTNPSNIGDKYENKVSQDGRMINNPLYGLGFKTTVDTAYQTNTVFGGEDSVGSNILGFMRTTGYRSNWGFHAGFVYGFYMMSNQAWIDKGIMHTNALQISDKYSAVPLIGIDLSQEIPLGRTVYLKINNLITPVLTNHSLSLGFNY